jgi:hypothetical protein
MNNIYKIIADVDELNWFYDNVISASNPKSNQGFAVQLFARTKHLSAEEKGKLQMPNAKLLDVFTVSAYKMNFLHYKRAFLRMQVDQQVYLSPSGMAYPQEALVAYTSVNPTDSYKALFALEDYIASKQRDMNFAALKGQLNEDDVRNKFLIDTIIYKYKTLLADNVLKQHYWLDIDIDLTDVDSQLFYSNWYKMMFDFVGENNFVLIKTAGGYHTLVRRSAIKGNPSDVIDSIYKLHKFIIKEATINKNACVPTPGTLQYGKLVTVTNKWNEKI